MIIFILNVDENGQDGQRVPRVVGFADGLLDVVAVGQVEVNQMKLNGSKILKRQSSLLIHS